MTHISKEESGMPFYMADFTKADMDKIIYRVTKGKRVLDSVMVYTGEEGSGKTTKATQDAYYISQKANTEFGLDNYSFTPQQFIDAIHDGKPKGTVRIYDEAINGLLATMSNTKKGIRLQITFGTCRSKGYPILLAAPRVYQLPYWMVYDRALAMYSSWIDYKDNEDLEGTNKYVGYNRASLRNYYALKKMHKNHEAFKVPTTRADTFSGWPFLNNTERAPFTHDAYESAKQAALKEEDTSDVRKTKKESAGELLIQHLHFNKGWSYAEIARACGLSESFVGDMCRKIA